MKKFIVDLFILTGLLIMVNLLIYWFITKGLLYRDYESPMHGEIEKYNTFIFSDSHGWSLTRNSPKIESALEDIGIKNLSYGSDSYEDILAKLLWLLDQSADVDTIILTVDDHMLTKRSNNQNRIISYHDSKNYTEIYSSSSRMKFYYYKIVRYLPMLYPSNQSLIKQYFNARLFGGSDTISVIQWSDQNADLRLAKARERIKSFYPKNEFRVLPSQVKALEKILNLTIENEITVIGIKFPISKVMRKETAMYKAKVQNYFYEMGGNKVLDYEELFDSPAFFSNQDHVNIQGADEVFRALKMDLHR